MTEQQAQAPAVLFKASPEESDRLRARADELYQEAALIEHEADLAYARSEAMILVLAAAMDLGDARLELDDARTQLAEATAAFDPVQADLARVQAELASTTITGNLDQRIAARTRRLALEEELGPLEELAGQLMQPVSNLRNLVTSLERDSIPYFEAELAARKAAIADPPVHDLGKLSQVAPGAASMIAIRSGLIMLQPEQVRTPHGQQVLLAVTGLLRMTGLGTAIKAQVEGQLMAELPADLAGKVRSALSFKRQQDSLPEPVPEYKGITGETVNEPPGLVKIDPITGLEPGPSLDRFPSFTIGRDGAGGQLQQLPVYDSAEGARLRAADQAARQPRYRGPADWPR